MYAEDNWSQLKKDYSESGIALALGAGVSYGSKLPGWRQLLERIAYSYGTQEHELVTVMIRDGYSLPAIASVLEADRPKDKEFGEIIRDALYQDFEYYRKSSPRSQPTEFEEFIKTSNPTLSAIAALCACKEDNGVNYTANPRIHAIANTNFDAILSVYSRARFRTYILRTVERPSAKAIRGRINVGSCDHLVQIAKRLPKDSSRSTNWSYEP